MIAISIQRRTLGRAKIKEPFWLKNADAVLLRLFTFSLPPTPSSLDYVPPEVVSPETSLLGFFLTEALNVFPKREPNRTLETFVSYVPNRPLSEPLPPSQRLSTPLERPLELSP